VFVTDLFAEAYESSSRGDRAPIRRIVAILKHVRAASLLDGVAEPPAGHPSGVPALLAPHDLVPLRPPDVK
jgi:hypothetical protein